MPIMFLQEVGFKAIKQRSYRMQFGRVLKKRLQYFVSWKVDEGV